MIMEYLIRRRIKNDCKQIAHIVTVAWNETYKGLVPEWFLEQLKNNENERAEKSYNEFDKTNNNQLVLEVDNKVVGFVNYGKSHDEEFSDCGEIYALYIIGDYQGNGLGKKLVEEAKIELKRLGFNKMIISCLKGNISNEFYKHIGGKYIKEGIYQRLNIPENIYYFENI
jgi:GNAT superfamily N-acetyltransferase